MDVAERELDCMIERRSRNGEVDPDERDKSWKTSVAAYNARRSEEIRLEWCDYFERLAVMPALSSRGVRRQSTDIDGRRTERNNVMAGNFEGTLRYLASLGGGTVVGAAARDGGADAA